MKAHVPVHPVTESTAEIIGRIGAEEAAKGVTAWIKTLPGDAATPAESAAGVLAGFGTELGGAPRVVPTDHVDVPAQEPCDYCSAGWPLYVQDSVTQEMPKTRIPFNYSLIGRLGADNVLHARIAEFLNTTGKAVHLELTWSAAIVRCGNRLPISGSRLRNLTLV